MAVSRKMLVDYIQRTLSASSVVILDDFDTVTARHICHGAMQIRLLPRDMMTVVLPNGIDCIDVDYYFCRNCGKLFLNKSSITLVGGEQVVRPVPMNMYGGGAGMANPAMRNVDARVAMQDYNPGFGAAPNYPQGYENGYAAGNQFHGTWDEGCGYPSRDEGYFDPNMGMGNDFFDPNGGNGFGGPAGY